MCVDGRRKVLELILPGGRANDLAEGRVYITGGLEGRGKLWTF